MSFIGKVILITGASSGIGAACAEFFAKKGALLALVGRDEEKFERVVITINECGVEMEPLAIVADVTVEAERIISETIEKYGRIDILINCAGFASIGSIETTKMEEFDAIMACNVRAVFELTQLAAPHLIESKGNIVNVSSICSLRAFKNCISYSISKAALDHLTRCAAMELQQKGVRVNCVNPGFIDTGSHSIAKDIEWGSDEHDESVETSSETHPMGRIGQVQDCVNAISFLAKDSSTFVTSITLSVDGGRCNMA